MNTTLDIPAGNELHRRLFSLPPLRPSEQTLPAVQKLPPKQRVTNDLEIDAVLWLRAVIATGDAALIAKAREGAKKIKVPLKELEQRYAKHLVDASGGHPFAALSSFGFADLDSLAKRSIDKRARYVEAMGRFGTEGALFANTPAEEFCVVALKGLEPQEDLFGQLDPVAVGVRFRQHPAEMPHTLDDCLHELTYWDGLAMLRYAFGTAEGDPLKETDARSNFVRLLLAEIPPRTRSEALSVLAFIYDNGREGDRAMRAILTNLIG